MSLPNLWIEFALLVAGCSFVLISRARLRAAAISRGEAEPQIVAEPKPSTRTAIINMLLSGSASLALFATNKWIAAVTALVIASHLVVFLFRQFVGLGFKRGTPTDRAFLLTMLALTWLSFVALFTDFIRWRYVGA